MARRILADVPEEAYWRIKTETSARQLKMKEMVPLAVARFLGLDLTAEELGVSAEALETINKMLNEKEGK